MRCSRCKQKQATVKLTRIIHGKVEELHLCQDCAAQESPYQKKFLAAQSLNQLLEKLFGVSKEKEPPAPEAESAAGAEEAAAAVSAPAGELVCKTCQLTFSRYKRTLMLGCPDCYESFGAPLLTDLRKIHGSVIHTGRVPRRHQARREIQRRIEELQERLDLCVSEEDYGQAARIRDEIETAKKELERLDSA